MTKIDKIYQILIDIVETYLPTIYTKADTEDFERIPAIGFGLPVIEKHLLELSESQKVNIDIPVVIVDAGANPLITLNVVKIYEDFYKYFHLYIDSYLTTNGISYDVWELSTFQPLNVPINDKTFKGLSGTVSFRIKLE